MEHLQGQMDALLEDLAPWQRSIVHEVMAHPQDHYVISVPRAFGRSALQKILEILSPRG